MNEKTSNDSKSLPFVTSIDSVQALSPVEGLRERFSATLDSIGQVIAFSALTEGPHPV
jgi:hypothetical protein